MKRIVAFAFVAMLSGCATPAMDPVTQRNSALTPGNVSLNVEVGRTTQAQILEVFGAPNIVTSDGSGNEIWSYQRHATVSQSSASSSYWSIVLFGSGQYADGFQQSQRTITLIIKFNKAKVVADFMSRSSEF